LDPSLVTYRWDAKAEKGDLSWPVTHLRPAGGLETEMRNEVTGIILHSLQQHRGGLISQAEAEKLKPFIQVKPKFLSECARAASLASAGGLHPLGGAAGPRPLNVPTPQTLPAPKLDVLQAMPFAPDLDGLGWFDDWGWAMDDWAPVQS